MSTPAGERSRWLERNPRVISAELRQTEDGHAIAPLYVPEDAEFDYATRLGFPGEAPYARHPYPAGYLGRYWQMRLYSGFGNAEDANQRWKYLLSRGNDGVSAAFDLPTQLGYDSDDPSIRHEVGKVGVAIDTLDDFRVLFDGIPIERVPVSMNIVDAGVIMIAMLACIAEERGLGLEVLAGTLSNDILTEYASRGTWHFPPLASLRLQANVTTFCATHMPRFYPMNVRGILLHEAHATPAQEVGITFANALCYIDEAIRQGATIDDVGPRVSFFFGASSRIFETAAKFRAARLVWYRLVTERYQPSNPDAARMRFTSTFGGHWYRTRMPEMNLVRAAYGVLGCVLGGTQGMILGGYDEAYALPTERTARMALMTQQICAEETDAAATIDPLGGSYFVEHLTNLLEADICNVMRDLDEHGGAITAVEQGYVQRLLEDRAFRIKVAEDSGEIVVVGVNKYADDSEDHDLELHRLDDRSVQMQIDRLRRTRAEREAEDVAAALAELARTVADPSVNVIPVLMRCARARATVAEMLSIMVDVLGRFEEPNTA